MTTFYKFIVFICASLFIIACTTPENKIKAGSICTIESGDGTFGVVKVLVINNEEAHIKIYKNKYEQRPKTVDIKTLRLGSIDDKEGGFGIGHVPLHREGFDNWKPTSVGFEEVTPEDLAGYELWKNR